MTTERNTRIEKAVVKLRRLSTDEQARYIFEMHEKARRDEESLLRWARIEGQQEGEIKGKRESDEKWQTVVADKDAEIARLREQLKNNP